MKTKNIPPDIKSKSINEAKIDISDIFIIDIIVIHINKNIINKLKK